MKKLFALAVPILPGKTEKWREFSKSLKGEHYNDFKASRDRLGVHERTFLQQTPNGDYAVVTLEGKDPEVAFSKFAEGNDTFTKWFTEKVKEIHGMDLTTAQKDTLPELAIDSHESTPARA